MKCAVLLLFLFLFSSIYCAQYAPEQLEFLKQYIKSKKPSSHTPLPKPWKKWTPSNDESILAGVARVDSTLPIGVPLAGYNHGARRVKNWPLPHITQYTAFMTPSTGVEKPLWAKCLVLQSGAEKVCFCTIDAIGADGDLFALAYKTAVQEGFTIPWENVVLSASHSHSGPGGVSSKLLWELAPATDIIRTGLQQQMANAIAAAMIEADRNIQPIKFGIGISDLTGATYNRRAKISPYVNSTTIDSQLSIFRIDDFKTGKPIATLWNFAVHGVCYGPENMKQSGDIMGWANNLIENQIGGVSMFVNSDAGDIDPHGCTNEPDWDGSHTLANAVINQRSVISTMEQGMQLLVNSVTVDFGKTHLNLTLGRFFNCTKGICVLCENKFFECKEDVQLDNRWVEDQLKFTSVSLTLNNQKYAIVTAPGEPIQELGKQIKSDGIGKGYNHVLLFGYSNNHIGYITTAREYLIGGYESQLTFWGVNTANYIRGNVSLALDKVSH